MGSIGMPELIVIFLVILLLFGSKRLPELAQGLGKGIREFRKATNEIKSELDVKPIRKEIENDIKKGLEDLDKPQQPDKQDELDK